MKTELLLDYETILANRALPVHLALRFTAPEVRGGRTDPIAFCLVIDRSGSMAGAPLAAAREAARLVARNLRKNDFFAIVVFDSEARVISPLQAVDGRAELLRAIDSIEEGGSTNMTGGWMLGRDELKKAPPGLARRLLLLTDGHLNVGIVEPAAVRQVVASGMERDRITTSCLGFGDGYEEDLLADLAKATNGGFHDANSPEKLPSIFEAELKGLQAIAVQNLRARFRRLDFCDRLEVFGDYPLTGLPGGGVEASIGSLVSGEERVLVAALDVPPLPLAPDGTPVADLKGEPLAEVEVLHDSLDPGKIGSHRWQQVVRVLPVQEEKDLRTNAEVIGLVSAHEAARTLSQAIAEADRGRLEEAVALLERAIRRLRERPATEAAEDGLRMLENFLERLHLKGHWTARERKSARYHSEYYSKMSSGRMWTGEGPAPSFSRPPRRQGKTSPEAPSQEEEKPRQE